MLAVAALFADRPCRTFATSESWRVKETDRIAAMATELRKLGATVEDIRKAYGGAAPRRDSPAAIDTYDDHRMAMRFSLGNEHGGLPRAHQR